MILGLDVSTSIVGIAILNDDGILLSTDYVDLTKETNFYKKSCMVKDKLEHIELPITTVFIEDKLSGFAGGKTMQQTIVKLAAFNGVVSYLTNEIFKFEPTHIHPSTVKAIMKRDGLVVPKGADKKKLTVEFCRQIKNFQYNETKTGNPKPYCYDMADAYICGRAGFLKFANETTKDR